MEKPECNSGVEPDKKRKRNPEYWERKKLHATDTTTAIKRGLARLSKDKNMTSLFEIRCLASITNLGTGGTIGAKDNDLFESVQVYPFLLPESYEPIDRIPSLAVVLENIAQQPRENFAVSISVNFFSRVGRWFRLKIQERSSRTATTCFNNYESRVIKSLILMLIRACTQEEMSLDKLVLQYPRLQRYLIPCATKQWLQSLVNEFRSKVPLPLKLSEEPHAYLPFLYFVLKEIEKYNQDLNLHDQSDPRAIKVFALLPRKKLRSISIKLVDIPVRDLWNHYFDLTKSTESKTKNFSHFIVADGLSASVNLVWRRKVSLQAREESSVDVLFAQADRVVAVNPRRNPVFTAVVYDRRAMHDLAKPYPRNKAKHKVVTWSRSQWYSEAGYTHRQNVTKRWTEKAAGIATFNSEVSTAKTVNLSAIESHARHVLYYLPAVLDFYCARRFRRLKWKTYIRTQKAYCKIVADLSGGSAKTDRFGGPAVPRRRTRESGCAHMHTAEEARFQDANC